MSIRSGEGGFSLIEIAVAGSILAIALAGLAAAYTTFTKLNALNGERMIAANAAREMFEELKQTRFGDLVNTYGPNSPSHGNFAVTALTVRAADQDRMVGRITLHTSEAENFPALGLPRDLDANGAVNSPSGNGLSPDVSTTYALLPVTIWIEWANGKDDAQFELNQILVSY